MQLIEKVSKQKNRCKKKKILVFRGLAIITSSAAISHFYG
jgi:hypothetical protein